MALGILWYTMANKKECLEGSPETDEDHCIVIHGDKHGISDK